MAPQCVWCSLDLDLQLYPCIEQQLLETGESFESYVCNVFYGKVWGDDLVAAAFGDMWNISILIITPISKTPINLFHNCGLDLDLWPWLRSRSTAMA